MKSWFTEVILQAINSNKKLFDFQLIILSLIYNQAMPMLSETDQFTHPF